MPRQAPKPSRGIFFVLTTMSDNCTAARSGGALGCTICGRNPRQVRGATGRGRTVSDRDELDDLTDAWHRGYAAYQAGEPVDANPYVGSSLLRSYWQDGYEVAKREAHPPAPQRRWKGAPALRR
jgi:ribosome modulation factor